MSQLTDPKFVVADPKNEISKDHRGAFAMLVAAIRQGSPVTLISCLDSMNPAVGASLVCVMVQSQDGSSRPELLPLMTCLAAGASAQYQPTNARMFAQFDNESTDDIQTIPHEDEVTTIDVPKTEARSELDGLWEEIKAGEHKAPSNEDKARAEQQYRDASRNRSDDKDPPAGVS